MNRKLASIFVVFVAIFALSSVSFAFFENNSKILIGKWQDQNTNLEFFEDNTVMIEEMGAGFGGKWIILQDGRIKIDIEMYGTKMIMLGNLKDDSLNMNFGGSQMNFKKKIK